MPPHEPLVEAPAQSSTLCQPPPSRGWPAKPLQDRCWPAKAQQCRPWAAKPPQGRHPRTLIYYPQRHQRWHYWAPNPVLVLLQDILLLLPVAAHGPYPRSCDPFRRGKQSRGGKRHQPLRNHSVRGKSLLCRAVGEHRYPVVNDDQGLCRALGDRAYPVPALWGDFVLWRALGECDHPDPPRSVDHALRDPVGKQLHPVDARGADHVPHTTRRWQN